MMENLALIELTARHFILVFCWLANKCPQSLFWGLFTLEAGSETREKEKRREKEGKGKVLKVLNFLNELGWFTNKRVCKINSTMDMNKGSPVDMVEGSVLTKGSMNLAHVSWQVMVLEAPAEIRLLLSRETERNRFGCYLPWWCHFKEVAPGS